MIKKLALLLSLIASQAVAQDGTCSLCCMPPLICPPRNWIITLGISNQLTQDISGNYYGGFTGQYAGTMSLWTLQVGPIQSKTPLEAYNRFTSIIQTTALSVGPIQVSSCTWICIYTNLAHVGEVAYTPPIGCFNTTAP